MTSTPRPWTIVAREICSVLGEGLDVRGVVEAADVFAQVGQSCLEIVVEASDLVGADQVDAYRVLCDLLDTRRATTADEVIGFLLFETEAEAEPFVAGMAHMRRVDGAIVPVVPLGESQARDLADAEARFADLAGDVAEVIRTSVSDGAAALDDARDVLDRVDRLIQRACDT